MQNLEAQANQDLLKAQIAIRSTTIKAEVKGQYGNYITLDALLNAVVPHLNENNFFFTQGVEAENDGKSYVVTKVRHTNGTVIKLHTIQMGFTGLPKDIQKLGGEQTYLRKYGISAAFGLYGEQDDDGQSLVNDSQEENKKNEEKLTKEQANHIKNLVKGREDLLVKILERAGKKLIGDFEQHRYEGMVEYIEKELKKGVA